MKWVTLINFGGFLKVLEICYITQAPASECKTICLMFYTFSISDDQFFEDILNQRPIKVTLSNVVTLIGWLIFVNRGFSWGWRPLIFANYWTTKDLKVAGHKSITIICFFLSEIIFREKMVSLSNKIDLIMIRFFFVKAQGQIWDILQGVSSLRVSFTRKILAWYDK